MQFTNSYSDQTLKEMSDEELVELINEGHNYVTSKDEAIINAMRGLVSPAVMAEEAIRPHKMLFDRSIWITELAQGMLQDADLETAQQAQADAATAQSIISTAATILFSRREQKLREEFLRGNAINRTEPEDWLFNE